LTRDGVRGCSRCTRLAGASLSCYGLERWRSAPVVADKRYSEQFFKIAQLSLGRALLSAFDPRNSDLRATRRLGNHTLRQTCNAAKDCDLMADVCGGAHRAYYDMRPTR
jgi:hypothetical protein